MSGRGRVGPPAEISSNRSGTGIPGGCVSTTALKCSHPVQARPLLLAVRDGHLASVRELLAQGSDPNFPIGDQDDPMMTTPFLAAILSGRNTVISALIAAGADIHLANSHGATPLWCVCMTGNFDAAVMLLSMGASLDVHVSSDDGTTHTPLSIAIDRSHLDIAALVREAARPCGRRRRTTHFPTAHARARSSSSSWACV